MILSQQNDNVIRVGAVPLIVCIMRACVTRGHDWSPCIGIFNRNVRRSIEICSLTRSVYRIIEEFVKWATRWRTREQWSWFSS